ncbi:MAG: methyltransferase [Clostridia bacterium]|nr:methyltransferase [Clostridia bacterium]
MHTLKENERQDKVNDDITLIQRTDGLTYGTDALLLSAYINASRKKCVEFGSGTGIISLMMLARNKAKVVYAYEVQKEFANLTYRNAIINCCSEKLKVINKDIREANVPDIQEEADIVFSNPPYMKNGAGLTSATDEKNIARREVFGSIFDFCAAAKRLLKYGGKFYCVYRPDRLAELIHSLKSNSLEPKKMTFVHPHADSSPSLVLLESRLGGGEELKITRPLIIYEDKTHTDYTCDMQYIYDNGNFNFERF